jgi:hypothetical protein
MKYPSYLSLLVLVTALTVTGCGGNQTTNKPPLDQPTSPAASPSTAPPPPFALSPSASSPTASSPTASSPAASGQIYRQSEGLFEISLPQGFTYQETGSGIAFASADEGFGGSIDYGSAEGNRLTTKQLEDALKQEYESRLSQVSWQDSQIQPDGSIRVDWVGRDKDNNDLDSISFVEQRGDRIFILNLFGINKPYNDYNSAAQAIVSSYKVGQP